MNLSFLLVLTLFVFVMMNDIARIIWKKYLQH
jgi:hypothetical protein